MYTHCCLMHWRIGSVNNSMSQSLDFFLRFWTNHLIKWFTPKVRQLSPPLSFLERVVVQSINELCQYFSTTCSTETTALFMCSCFSELASVKITAKPLMSLLCVIMSSWYKRIWSHLLISVIFIWNMIHVQSGGSMSAWANKWLWFADFVESRDSVV